MCSHPPISTTFTSLSISLPILTCRRPNIHIHTYSPFLSSSNSSFRTSHAGTLSIMASTPQPTKTIALYQKDGALHTLATTISSISPLSSLPEDARALFKKSDAGDEQEAYVLTMPETIFHAQGGGQPSDTGRIVLENATSTTPEQQQDQDQDQEAEPPIFHVRHVRHLAPSILHMGVFAQPQPATPLSLQNGAVTQHVDPGPRLLHSRLHTAGHALGLAVMSLTTASPSSPTPLLPPDLQESKASHTPGTASVEFVGLIPSAAKAAIQDAVDALVARDLPVRILFMTEEEARGRCGAVAEGVKGDVVDGVRVVEIEGAGAYPCGGTHVGRLGEVGRVVVRGVKRQKGVSKVSYEVADV